MPRRCGDKALSEPVGPYLVPRELGKPPMLIHQFKRVELDHTSAVHWWRVLNEYLDYWVEAQSKESRDNG